MPGAYSLLDEVNPTAVAETPKEVKIWLPSQLPSGSHDKLCIVDLPRLKFRFRLAQAHDALNLIQHLLGAYHVLLMKNQVHISKSQGTMTKSKTLFQNFKNKIDQAAACYRDARAALLHLDPIKAISCWKENLKELHRDHIHGPSHESNEMSKSRHQPSWIWQTSSLEGDTGINDPELQDIMRIEWCKAIAQAERFKEEVELTVEEMRRTLLYFEWTANHWEQLGQARVGEPMMDGDTTAGMRAYAARQAALYRKLVDLSLQEWYECLELKSLGSDWLPTYPRPTFCQRRRLQSNVVAYHSSASSHDDGKHDALTSDPSDGGTEFFDSASEFDIDFDDF